jgi:hypothetical protein
MSCFYRFKALSACFLFLFVALPSSALTLSKAEAERLAALPLHCIQTQYPNKLQQVLSDAGELLPPKTLHPAFYGCFDWHSSVHGHWTLIKLLQRYPDLKDAKKARTMLAQNMSAANIQAELAYFKDEGNKSFERTYGWAWLLKLDQALQEWNDPLAKQLAANLAPLTQYLREAYLSFLPKLVYPIRVGEHSNTAFGLAFALDWAEATADHAFAEAIHDHAKRFYSDDKACPLAWEPSGFDFLSPCLEEARLMSRVLAGKVYDLWLADFLPGLGDTLTLTPGEIRDRSDGKLVHLDGLNFSRAWNLYGLAHISNNQRLRQLADEHLSYSLPNIVDEHYSGTHWLASFALYALLMREQAQ